MGGIWCWYIIDLRRFTCKIKGSVQRRSIGSYPKNTENRGPAQGGSSSSSCMVLDYFIFRDAHIHLCSLFRVACKQRVIRVVTAFDTRDSCCDSLWHSWLVLFWRSLVTDFSLLLFRGICSTMKLWSIFHIYFTVTSTDVMHWILALPCVTSVPQMSCIQCVTSVASFTKLS
jgi:hypothetical protein